MPSRFYLCSSVSICGYFPDETLADCPPNRLHRTRRRRSGFISNAVGAGSVSRDGRRRSYVMKTRTRLALMVTMAIVSVVAVFWLWRPSFSPLAGLWIDATGEQIRFRADGVFSIVEKQPLIGNMFSVPRDEQFMQGRYTFLDATHIRTEFTHNLGSPRVFVLSPTGELFWTNHVTGQLFTYGKRRFPL